VGDLTLFVFYYLRVGEYTIKSLHNNTKWKVQFKMEDVTFFHYVHVHLQPPPPKHLRWSNPYSTVGYAQVGLSELWVERGVYLLVPIYELSQYIYWHARLKTCPVCWHKRG
jgi:hypothetical protein